MKSFFISVFLLAAFVVGCGPKGEDPDAMIAAAKALDQQFFEAMNKGDVDAIMATYWNSPDLVSYGPGELEVRGWDAAKESMAMAMSSMPGGKLEQIDSNYKVAGDMVISWGKWKMTMPAMEEGGAPMEMLGRYTDVKAKKDGKWVYIVDHASVPMPPPPAEAEEK